MKALIKPALFLLGIFLLSESLMAQDTKNESKDNNIIIRKKGDSKEKMTIVIDGDKVTINGKPADDYKDDDLQIIRGGDIGDDMFMPPMAAMAPMAKLGMMDRDFMREVRSNKAFLGVMTDKTDDGAKVTEVTKESAAEKAGLKEGDIITKINDEKITDADDLYKVIGKYKPEDKITVTYKRDGKENKQTVTLGENQQVRAFSWKRNGGDNDDFNFDMNMAPNIKAWGGGNSMMFDRRPRLGIQVQETEDSKGVKVLDVDVDEPAGKAGLQEDDIITSIKDKSVSSIEILKEQMENIKEGDTVKLSILRDGKAQTINIKFPKELKTTDL